MKAVDLEHGTMRVAARTQVGASSASSEGSASSRYGSSWVTRASIAPAPIRLKVIVMVIVT